MGYDILNIDSGNWTVGLYMADYSVGDDGVDTCFVVCGLEEFDYDFDRTGRPLRY